MPAKVQVAFNFSMDSFIQVVFITCSKQDLFGAVGTGLPLQVLAVVNLHKCQRFSNEHLFYDR